MNSKHHKGRGFKRNFVTHYGSQPNPAHLVFMEYQSNSCGVSLTWLFSLLCILLAATGTDTQPGSLQEYCDTESFTPKCAENEVIMMQSAKYGRMRLGKCVEIDLGYLGCYTDVLDLADRRCSGRQACEIRVPDKDFESTRPCLKELKTYLEISYSCLPVHTGDINECLSSEYINITSPVGWLASLITMETNCGTYENPWIIHAEAGQRINVTLYDFWPEHPYSTNNLEYDVVDTHVCKEYAMIQEVTSEWNSVVCGEGKRVQNVYISKTNSIQIQLTNKDKRYFVLKYEAVGCPDLPTPIYGYFEREESGGVIGCLHSPQKWHIACSGTEWVGYVGNCSAPQAVPIEDIQSFDLNLPLGASIAIIIGAALGVGLVVVIIGLLKFKGLFPFRKRNRPYGTPPPRDTILLREKSPQSEMQQDSGNCSLDTPQENTDNQLQLQQQQQQQGQQPRVLRHQRVVKINGSEYAHIWETPLPEPCASGEMPSCRICPRDPRDPHGRGVNTVYMLRCKPGEGHCCETMKQFPPYPKQTSAYEAPRYSTLDRNKSTYGTTTASASSV